MPKTDDPIRDATNYIEDVLASQVRLGYRAVTSEEAYQRAVKNAAAPLAELMRIQRQPRVDGDVEPDRGRAQAKGPDNAQHKRRHRPR